MKFNSIYLYSLSTLMIGSTLAHAGHGGAEDHSHSKSVAVAAGDDKLFESLMKQFEAQSAGQAPIVASETGGDEKLFESLMKEFEAQSDSSYEPKEQPVVYPTSSKEEGSYQKPTQYETSKEETSTQSPVYPEEGSKEVYPEEGSKEVYPEEGSKEVYPEETSTQNPVYPEEGSKEETPVYPEEDTKYESPIQNDTPYFPPAYNETEVDWEDKYGKSEGGNDTESVYPEKETSTPGGSTPGGEVPVQPVQSPEQSTGKTEELGGGSGAATISVSMACLFIASLFSALL